MKPHSTLRSMVNPKDIFLSLQKSEAFYEIGPYLVLIGSTYTGETGHPFETRSQMPSVSLSFCISMVSDLLGSSHYLRQGGMEDLRGDHEKNQ